MCLHILTKKLVFIVYKIAFFVTEIRKVTKLVTKLNAMINANVRLVFDRKNITKGKKDIPGLIQIEVRLIGSSKRVFISTNKSICLSDFSYKDGNFTCKNRNDADTVTRHIRSMLKKINNYILSDQCRKLEDVKLYDTPTKKSDLVIPFVESEMRSRSLKLGTVKQHNVIIHKLEEFKKIVVFDDLTYNNIVEFDKHIRKDGLDDVTAHKRHSTLNSYLREAVRRGLLSNNPYDTFKPKRGKAKDAVYLTIDELKVISEWKASSQKLDRVRDLFLFQCFTGMGYSDLEKFGKSEIKQEGDYEIIRSNRIKTDERFVIPLLPDAKKILLKYNYELPIITNQKYNDYLKVIAEFCKIDKKVTSHTARHSFAIYLLNEGVPIEAVSVALGHSNIKMTQHYAKLLAQSTIKAIADKIINKNKE